MGACGSSTNVRIFRISICLILIIALNCFELICGWLIPCDNQKVWILVLSGHADFCNCRFPGLGSSSRCFGDYPWRGPVTSRHLPLDLAWRLWMRCVLGWLGRLPFFLSDHRLNDGCLKYLNTAEVILVHAGDLTVLKVPCNVDLQWRIGLDNRASGDSTES